MLEITYAIYAIAFFFFAEKMYKQLSTLPFCILVACLQCMLQCLFIQTSSHLFRNKCFELKGPSREGKIWTCNMHPTPIWISNYRKICNKKKKNIRKKSGKREIRLYNFHCTFFLLHLCLHTCIYFTNIQHVDIQRGSPPTRSQCRVSATWVTAVACGPLVSWLYG